MSFFSIIKINALLKNAASEINFEQNSQKALESCVGGKVRSMKGVIDSKEPCLYLVPLPVTSTILKPGCSVSRGGKERPEKKNDRYEKELIQPETFNFHTLVYKTTEMPSEEIFKARIGDVLVTDKSGLPLRSENLREYSNLTKVANFFSLNTYMVNIKFGIKEPGQILP